jgi:DNA-binding GntR family transcriptional regulator
MQLKPDRSNMPKAPAQKISQVDNSLMIYEILKDEIVNLKLTPGTAISENLICERFSVSRTPVRTVFQRLSDGGFIKIVPYKETIVTLLNLSQIKQMIYMRVAIESMMIRDFIDRLDPYAVEKIRYFLRKQLVLLETDFTPSDFFVEDSAFHRIWYSAMGMDFLWHTIQQAQVHYTRYRMLDYIGNRETGVFSTLQKEHEQLFSIILKKDKQAVEPMIAKHISVGIKRLGKRIQADLAGYFEDA